MSSSNQKNFTRFTRSARTRTLTVCVVDPRNGDYAACQSEAIARDTRIEFRTDAAAALRLAREQHVDLWVVNAQLPGLSGVELCAMLKSQPNGATVYLFADQYSPELEQAALRSGATIFTCKPAVAEVLLEWIAIANRARSASGGYGSGRRCA